MRTHNERSQAELEAEPGFEPLRKRVLAILDSSDKIPWVRKRGRHYYNFWRDADHPKGLWRRVSSLRAYRKGKPRWQTVLDVDALADKEGESWVWKGAVCLYPKRTRCLVRLSRGGADATVVREFDTIRRAFVKNGFYLPEAKSHVAWRDRNTLYVGTDFGPGSMTDSGYPRQVKLWKRGTPLSAAKPIFEGKRSDVTVGAYRSWDHGHVRDFVYRNVTFYSSQHFLLEQDGLVRIEVPDSAMIDTWDDQLLVTLRDDWKLEDRTWSKGSLLATNLSAFLDGRRGFTALFTPEPTKSLEDVTRLKTALIVNELEHVKSRLWIWTLKGKRWRRRPLEGLGLGTFSAGAVEANESDAYWFTATDFTQPSTLSHATLGKRRRQLKQTPAFFDASGLEVSQHFATSADGTQVPYFQVSKRDLRLDGNNPTLLYGYGGFEISLKPRYRAVAGAAWLEHGGVYVQANIRGGGEYGPSWHQAALKSKRQRAYDDFAAVAQDLIRRKVTRPERLGIQGGSNGGLLMGVMLTQRPELFGAIVCRVPLLDMRRYSVLLAGASWVGEYGDPSDPEQWAWISKYSPYQNLKMQTNYPPALFMTSTRDDRVHPGHARKMVARMDRMGYRPLYYENIEGGHGGAANNEQRAHMAALAYVFLAKRLGLELRTPEPGTRGPMSEPDIRLRNPQSAIAIGPRPPHRTSAPASGSNADHFSSEEIGVIGKSRK
ncbi:MAG: prolyl oligopeptidase family serine peptidase [Proteobacteria bacterium]|nr:prolyl oligopeptidase family serine peptidase [Pseudomonadota bacterium]